MRQADAERLARRFKALGDPTRVRLLSFISRQDSGEACVCHLTGHVGLSQSTVSHHLKVLAEAGLVTGEQRGTWAYYRVLHDGLDTLREALTSGRPERRRLASPARGSAS